jgi:hypothetical protein
LLAPGDCRRLLVPYRYCSHPIIISAVIPGYDMYHWR